MQKDPSRLPPPDLLLGFEAAARHLSFTRAAQERFVTQSAISRQIRALEDDLGVTLFRRQHRALSLTDEGRALHEACHEAFERLQRTVSRLRAPASRQLLTVTTTPGLASLWLIPRLTGFTRGQPGIDVRIDASYQMRKLDAEGIDVAIRYVPLELSPGTRLFEESMLPVCSPALLRSGPPLAEPGDLARHTLLRSVESGIGPMYEWAPWLAAMGLPELEPAATLSFTRYDEVVAAAVLGQGVALGRKPLIDELLTAGRLVAPVAGPLASPRGYFVVVNEAGRDKPAVRALHAWLLAAAAAPTRAGRHPPDTPPVQAALR